MPGPRPANGSLSLHPRMAGDWSISSDKFIAACRRGARRHVLCHGYRVQAGDQHAQDHRCHFYQPRRRPPGGPQEDPTRGFTLGGWTAPHFDATLGASMGEIFGRPFDLLLGRKTYDIFAAHWPYVADPNSAIAAVFNRVTKYVASRSNPKLNWQNSQLLGTDIVASLKALKGEDGPTFLSKDRATCSRHCGRTAWSTNSVC